MERNMPFPAGQRIEDVKNVLTAHGIPLGLTNPVIPARGQLLIPWDIKLLS
jgi:hypothetical protein